MSKVQPPPPKHSGYTNVGSGTTVTATGQAGTVQTVANARFIERPNNVDFVTSVYSVVT